MTQPIDNYDEANRQLLYKLSLTVPSNLSGDPPQPGIGTPPIGPIYPPPITDPAYPTPPVGWGKKDPIAPGAQTGTSGHSVTQSYLTYCYGLRPIVFQSGPGAYLQEVEKDFLGYVLGAISGVISSKPIYPRDIVWLQFVASGVGVTDVTINLQNPKIGRDGNPPSESPPPSSGPGSGVSENPPTQSKPLPNLPIKSNQIFKPVISTNSLYVNVVPETIGTIPDILLATIRNYANLPGNVNGDIWRGANTYQFGSDTSPLGADKSLRVMCSLAYPLGFFRLYLSCFKVMLETNTFALTNKFWHDGSYNGGDVNAWFDDTDDWSTSKVYFQGNDTGPSLGWYTVPANTASISLATIYQVTPGSTTLTGVLTAFAGNGFPCNVGIILKNFRLGQQFETTVHLTEGSYVPLSYSISFPPILMGDYCTVELVHQTNAYRFTSFTGTFS